MKNATKNLYALEQLSAGGTCVHRLHPLVKLMAAAVFIVTVISFDRYAPMRLVPYIFYPMILTALSETPHSMLLKRVFIALPFCLFAGVTNVMFDTAAAFTVGGVAVSYGAVSLVTILIRMYLCVMAVLILVSVTPLSEITGEMRRLRVPNIFIITLEMTYRYIGVLLNEAYSMITAYRLRGGNKKGVDIRDMGSFAGQLLIRSLDRAERVYNAMACRGYALQNTLRRSRRLTPGDIIFLAVVLILCATFRLVDVNRLIAAGIFGGV
ncbi:MAG: cobalt ECF transporter T component CbiQ [Chitinispirillales bacterium]|jgi:cobalt/nickel transport system permease protein|nr:cobalt ECF transporter T component CbiQ [Chitinispirillales bacterium]